MTEREADILAKKKFPMTAKEKKCIDAFIKMQMNRSGYKKQLFDLEKRKFNA